MLVAEEEHDGARVVQLVHVVKVRHLTREENATSKGATQKQAGNGRPCEPSARDVQGAIRERGAGCTSTRPKVVFIQPYPANLLQRVVIRTARAHGSR